MGLYLLKRPAKTVKANEEGDRMFPWWFVAIAYIAGMIVGNVLTRDQ